MSALARCGGCTTTWTGGGIAHCARCHRTFTTVANFDRHRAGGQCADPASRGLVRNGRGQWTTEVDEQVRERLASIRRPPQRKDS